MNIKLKILQEAGFESAMLGLSLSFNQSIINMAEVSRSLYKKGGGHSKFLESLQIWIDITMPRYWWQEFDTYRCGTTKQSESTIHTIMRRKLTQDDFVDTISNSTLLGLNELIHQYKNGNHNKGINEDLFKGIKRHLPEGFLQRRIVNTNYKTLQNMIQQRKNHKLEEWQEFVKFLQENCKYKEYLV